MGNVTAGVLSYMILTVGTSSYTMLTVGSASYIMLIIGSFLFICAVLIAIVTYCLHRASMKRIRSMLNDAIRGDFKEKTFNESMHSAVEGKFAEYLDASEVSSLRLEEEKNKIKELIADIAHQTKTPIANLLLYTELLKEEEQTPESRQTIELLEAQTQKLSFLIDSLVKLSRLETGVIALAPKENKVAELLENAENQCIARAREKGLYLHVEKSGAQDIRAVFDVKWTCEALCNLIDNAVKYTEKGGVTVSVTEYQFFVSVNVTDTGMGISEEEQAKIFGRFYRSPKVSEKAGVGIGLYLAREILQKEGGYIKVVSKEGEGATFSLCLKTLQNC